MVALVMSLVFAGLLAMTGRVERERAQAKEDAQSAASSGDVVADIDHGAVPAEPVFVDRDGERVRLFTPDELWQHDGSDKDYPLYLAIAGEVYDVSGDPGPKHYGAGGGYAFFAGRDASKAFVTGDFAGEGLTDDVSTLSGTQLLEVDSWVSFYKKHETYKSVGIVRGFFYDGASAPTDALLRMRAQVAEARATRAAEAKEREEYPGCNSRWTSTDGGKVWCDQEEEGEGGKGGPPVRRRVPRKMRTSATGAVFCVCVPAGGADTGSVKMEVYPECAPSATECKV